MTRRSDVEDDVLQRYACRRWTNHIHWVRGGVCWDLSRSQWAGNHGYCLDTVNTLLQRVSTFLIMQDFDS